LSCCPSSFGLSSTEGWAGPLVDTASIFGTSLTEDVDSDVIGALGDGELGGLKSAYLYTRKTITKLLQTQMLKLLINKN
jgi:hypothetical protein